jgi:hypothetical protein
MTRSIAIGGLGALFGAILVAGIGAARADVGAPGWECGSFELPVNTYSHAKGQWTSPSDSGLVMKAGESGARLPSGWTPLASDGSASVVACRAVAGP